MHKEPVNFGLIYGQDTAECVGHTPTDVATAYDKSFANWMVAVKGYTFHNARLAAYRTRRVALGICLRTKEQAEALGAEVMMNDKLSKSTKRGYLYALEYWMEYQGVLMKFAHKPRPTARCPHYLDQGQLQTYVRASKDYREFAILSTFIYTGARLNEVRMLNIGDVDFTHKQILIRCAKLDKERYVPLDEALERVLKAHLARLPLAQQKLDSPLFQTHEGARVSDKWLGEIVRRVGDRVGLHVHPHMLRHSFASAWVENGGDVFTLSVILGHTDIKMTQRYWHYNQKTMRKAFGGAAPRL